MTKNWRLAIDNRPYYSIKQLYKQICLKIWVSFSNTYQQFLKVRWGKPRPNLESLTKST